MTKKVSLNVKCTHCNQSLMDYKKPINEKPSVKVNVKNADGDEGTLWLCSIYGCYDKVSDITLAEDTRVVLGCPHCDEILNTEIECKECNNGQMIKFNIEIGGVVAVCDVVGCPSHYVMFEDLTDTLRKFHLEYGV